MDFRAGRDCPPEHCEEGVEEVVEDSEEVCVLRTHDEVPVHRRSNRCEGVQESGCKRRDMLRPEKRDELRLDSGK